jgi:CelD/BcsL family acetyltransferase involved in cellulose biosynthesis
MMIVGTSSVGFVDSATGPLAHGEVALTIRRGVRGLLDLEQGWRQLEQRLTSKRFYHCFDWYRSYLDTLEPNPESVYFFSYASGARAIAIFPLRWKVIKESGLRLRCFELPEHSHLSLADCIFEKTTDNAELLRRLIQDLNSQSTPAWDVLRMARIPENGKIALCMDRAPPERLVSQVRDASHYISCSASYDAVASRLPGHFRRNLGRINRRIQQLGKVEFRSCRTPSDLAEAFESFLEIESSGWKGASGTGTAIACHPDVRDFYRHLMDRFAGSGHCVINLLCLDGEAIAGQFCLLVDGVLSVLKIGYRESFSHVAPGKLLFDYVLRAYCAGHEIKALNFVTAPEWDRLWRPEACAVATHRVYNTTGRGVLAYFLAKGQTFVGDQLKRAKAHR